MFQLSILIIGATTALLSLATNYALLLAYAITFGFFDGCFVGQVAVVTSSIVGMKHLAVALGYLFGSIAIPMTMGPPMAGTLTTRNIPDSPHPPSRPLFIDIVF